MTPSKIKKRYTQVCANIEQANMGIMYLRGRCNHIHTPYRLCKEPKLHSSDDTYYYYIGECPYCGEVLRIEEGTDEYKKLFYG